MKPRLFLLCVLAAFFVGMVGCSEHVGLSGKVFYSDNKEPVSYGEIQFSTPTFAARAKIGKNGFYKAGSYKKGDGLPPGTYKVSIISSDREGNPLVHPKFASSKTSGLEITIEQTTRAMNFEVDRAPPKPQPQNNPPRNNPPRRLRR